MLLFFLFLGVFNESKPRECWQSLDYFLTVKRLSIRQNAHKGIPHPSSHERRGVSYCTTVHDSGMIYNGLRL